MHGDPIYDVGLSFLGSKILSFRETRFIAQWNSVKDGVSFDFSDIPFTCVINADAIRG